MSFGADGGAGDAKNVFVYFPEFFIGAVIHRNSGAQMGAELFHIVFITAKMAAEFFDTLSDFFGGLFDLKSFKSLKNSLEISEKRSGGDDDNFFLVDSILDEVTGVGFDGAEFVYEQVVVDGFGRNKHKSEFHSSFGGFDVFGSFFDASFEILPE